MDKFPHRLDSDMLVALVETAQDAIIGLAPDGCVFFWNQAAQRLYGYESDEILGQPVIKLAPPEMVQEELRLLERAKRGEAIEQHHTIRLRRDGTRFHAALTLSVIRDSHGQPVLYSSITRDISSRRNWRKNCEKPGPPPTRPTGRNPTFFRT